jgi:hypothetical protein
MQRKTSIAAAAILLATVAACSKPEPAAEATPSAAAEPVAAATWTPALPAAGTYEVSTSEGVASATVTIEADNSYSQQPVKGLAEAGIVKLTDGKVCFDPSGKEAPTRCYTESVRAPDGSFTATDDKGVVENIKPVAK